MYENNSLTPFVSVVIPVKNEEKYINDFLENLLIQTYPIDKMEIIFSDGLSSDNTLSIINNYVANSDLSIKVLSNPKENAPSGLNLAIKHSIGDIIIRLDVHTSYPKEYIEKNVFYLSKGYGDNVGCPVETVGDKGVAKVISYMLSSRFGVGNSKFRVSAYEGLVDTVPFGCFYKSLIQEIGYFNEDMPRGEDNDFNYRIRKSGKKVYMFSDIVSKYYSRTSIFSLLTMAYANGEGIANLIKNDLKSISIRHLIPAIFVIGNIIGMVSLLLDFKLLLICWGVCILIYLILDLYYCLKGLFLYKSLLFLISFFLYPMFHFTYGIGTIFTLIGI